MKKPKIKDYGSIFGVGAYNYVSDVNAYMDWLENEALSNAKLIVAAPEMLKAMITFVERVERGEVRSKKTYAQFKSIIKKATE